MGWQKSRNGTPYYVIKRVRDHQIFLVYGGRGEAGRQAEQEDLALRHEWQQSKSAALNQEELFQRYEAQLNDLVDQALMGMGYLQRFSRWHQISRLKRPITARESAVISANEAIITPITFENSNNNG